MIESMNLNTLGYDAIVIHYGEVTLKRGKRGLFERILMNHLKRAVGLPVKRLQGRYVIELTAETKLDEVLSKIGKVFGVVWYAPAIKTNSLEELEDRLAKMLEREGLNRIKIETRRSDKRFPMTSLEVSKRIGKYLTSNLGLKIDLKNPEKRIFIEITEDGIYASLQKLRGPGGLPIGSSGKVLGLFSGGVLSAIACWYMMKRGCMVDLLHVSDGEFFQTEGYMLLNRLLEYSLECKLYLVPSAPFIEFSREIPENLRGYAFKFYLLKLGEEVAKRGHYLGLVWGHSAILGIRKLEEFCVVTRMRSLPSYAPLLSIDESELIRRASSLGMQEQLHLTRMDQPIPSPRELEKIWRKSELNEAVRRSLESVEVFRLRRGGEIKRIWPKPGKRS